tara:strand:- start:82 stop:336 length:255 start_codon:yes stop_codon:yes gene_type:complete
MWDAQTRVAFKQGQKSRQFQAFFGTDVNPRKHNTSSKPEDKVSIHVQQGDIHSVFEAFPDGEPDPLHLATPEKPHFLSEFQNQG